jgi:hypothetical protein
MAAGRLTEVSGTCLVDEYAMRTKAVELRKILSGAIF